MRPPKTRVFSQDSNWCVTWVRMRGEFAFPPVGLGRRTLWKKKGRKLGEGKGSGRVATTKPKYRSNTKQLRKSHKTLIMLKEGGPQSLGKSAFADQKSGGLSSGEGRWRHPGREQVSEGRAGMGLSRKKTISEKAPAYNSEHCREGGRGMRIGFMPDLASPFEKSSRGVSKKRGGKGCSQANQNTSGIGGCCLQRGRTRMACGQLGKAIGGGGRWTELATR